MKYSSVLELKMGTVIFLRSYGKTLMMKRNKKSPKEDFLFGNYVPPGGKIEMGESPLECAQRELYEETGLVARGIQSRGKVIFDNRNRNFQGKPAKFDFLVYVFEAHSYSGQLDLEKDNKGTPIWVQDDELNRLKCEKGDHFLFEWIKRRETINHVIRLSDDSAEVFTLD